MWKFVEELWRQWSSWLAHDWLMSGQSVKGHVRSTCYKPNSLFPSCILRVTSWLGQPVSDPQNSLPGWF